MPTRMPKISIVTPSYNQAGYIEDNIRSIIEQNYDNVEYIIVDGLSTDGTIDILNKYKNNDRISKIIIEKDNGQTDALIKGFNHCTGNIYGWINSDDMLEPNALSIIAQQFKENANIDILVGNLMVIEADGKEVGIWPRKQMNNEDWQNMTQGIGQPSVFFTSSAYKAIGGLSPDLEYSMDYDLFMRFGIGNYQFRYINNVLARFRVHSESKSFALPYKQWIEDFKVFRRNCGKIFSLFYYWRVRGIISTVIKSSIFKNRKW